MDYISTRSHSFDWVEMQNRIDHFAIGADTLEQGATAVQAALEMQAPAAASTT